MHLRGVDLLDPVQTILGVVGAGDVDVVVIVQDGQRTVDALGLADLDRGSIAQGRVLEHRLAVGVGGHFKNVKAVVLAVGAPVVLGRLDGDVHLVQPGADQGGIGCLGSDHTAAAVEATGEGTVLRGDIGGVGGQRGQGLPVGQVVDVGHVPAETDAVPAGFALGDIGGPFLREALGVDQVFGVQFVQPLDAVPVALLRGGADHFTVIGDSNVAALVHVAVALAEAVDEDGGVLVAVVDDAGHGDDAALDTEFALNGGGIVPEGDQHLLELVDGVGHLKAQEVEPLGVDERHIADGLDRGLVHAQLLDPGQGPDVALGVGAHGAVLGVLLKDGLQVGHTGVDVLLQGDDHTLLGVAEQVAVREIGGKNKVGQGVGVGHIQADLVAPLVGLDGSPLDVDVGGFFQPLENGAVVRFRFAACGIAGGAGQGDSLGQRELDGAVHHDGRSRFVAGRALAAAGGQSHGGAGQSGGLEEVAAGNHLFHSFFSFFFLVCVLQGCGAISP